MKKSVWLIIWQFKVLPSCQSDFEKSYGPDGEWVKLFRNHSGYLFSKLYQDIKEKNLYLTFDYWRSAQSYLEFKKQFQQPYQELDANYEQLTIGESLIIETMVDLD